MAGLQIPHTTAGGENVEQKLSNNTGFIGKSLSLEQEFRDIV